MQPRIVIVAYKPKAGKAEALQQLIRTHLSILKSLDLVTDRAFILMEAKDGTIIEVFEWKSTSAIEQAHAHPEVLQMWGRYAEVCDYVPIGKVEEAANLFSEFTPFI
jgi:hypothetical protein